MKTRMKRVVAFLLAIIIIMQVLPKDVLDTYAGTEPKIHFTLKTGAEGEVVTNATVRTTVSESNVYFEYKEAENSYISMKPRN